MKIKITHIKPNVVQGPFNGERSDLTDLIKTYQEEIANLEKKLSNNTAKRCHSPIECLAMFFEELSGEVRSAHVDSNYMTLLLAEVTKAIVHTQDEIEQLEG